MQLNLLGFLFVRDRVVIFNKSRRFFSITIVRNAGASVNLTGVTDILSIYNKLKCTAQSDVIRIEALPVVCVKDGWYEKPSKR